MDPNEVLRALRERVNDMKNLIDSRGLEGGMSERELELEELANEGVDLFEAIDRWMTSGGFLPSDWARRR